MSEESSSYSSRKITNHEEREAYVRQDSPTHLELSEVRDDNYLTEQKEVH